MKYLLTLIGSIALISSSCTTLTKSQNENNPEVVSTAHESHLIVGISGQSQPIIDAYGRKYWFDLRQKSQDELQKMYAALSMHEAETAEKEARAYLKKHPYNLDGLTILTLSLALAKKYELAFFYADLIERKYAENAITLNIKGLTTLMFLQNSRADYEKAIAYFTKAQANSGKAIAASLNLGNIYLELGNAQKASEAFESAISQTNDCIPALLGAAIAHSRLKQSDRGEQYLQAIVKLEPNHGEALYRLALIADKDHHDKSKAKEYLNRLINTPVKAPEQLVHRAKLLLNRIDADIDKKIAKDPNQELEQDGGLVTTTVEKE